MTRIEAIRKQHEIAVQTANAHLPPRTANAVRTRRRSLLWLWLLVFVGVLAGFFSCRKKLAPWFDNMLGTTNVSVPDNYGDSLNARTTGVSLEKRFADYITPSEAEMVQLFEYVRNSSHVRENLLYANVMGSVRFTYDPADSTVNAFAAVVRGDGAENGAIPVICMLGGAARFGRLAALAVALDWNGDHGAAARFINSLSPSDCSKMDDVAVVRIMNSAELVAALDDDKVLATAKSISAGLMLGILAHESGHHALGHVLGMSSSVNLDISRNQEREADSFASSVIASSPFGEYILVGTLFWHFALAHQESADGATTHPLSKERFENFVRANPDLAKGFGIDLT